MRTGPKFPMPVRGLFLASLIFAVPAGARAGRDRAVSPADSADYVMADFEGDDPLATPLRGYWYFTDDRYTPTANDNIAGNSLITSFDYLGKPLLDSAGGFDTASFPRGRSGEAGSRSLRFAYVLGTRRLGCGVGCTFDPFVAFGLIFTTWADTLDLTGATAISFWARSDSDTVAAEVSVGTRDTALNLDAPDYAQSFRIGPDWNRFTLVLAPSSDFKQPERGTRKPFDPKRVYGIGFRFNLGPNAARPADAISVDDITIEHWKYPEPLPDGIRGAESSVSARAGARMRICGSQVRIFRSNGISRDMLGRGVTSGNFFSFFAH